MVYRGVVHPQTYAMGRGVVMKKHVYLVKFVPKLCDNSELGSCYKSTSPQGAKKMFKKEWPGYKIIAVEKLK